MSIAIIEVVLRDTVLSQSWNIKQLQADIVELDTMREDDPLYNGSPKVLTAF
ncbi:MAG: hypothetical protein ACKPKO_22130 [Candidatus Fonsibacter sp.]